MSATAFIVTRDVSADDPHNHAERDVRTGERLYACTRAMYGCINTDGGFGATWDPTGDYPFFEFPTDAVREVTQ